MFRTTLLRGVSASALSLVMLASAFAQETLPTIDIGGQRQARPGRGGASPGAASTQPATVAAEQFAPGPGSLTVPSVAQLRRDLNRNAGSVAFVDADTPALQTRYVHDLRDALKDVPGVFVETRYGQELRISMRGSNLTRDYHLRGIELLQDGIPMNFADGSGDTYQIDPRYFRAVEVFRGGNGLAYGSSTLGGAINFISPTAYTAQSPNLLALDVGSFGTIRGQAQASRIFGDFDVLVNGTFTHSDGFRNHAQTDYTQINGNLGYRFSKDVETRFYFGAYATWQQLPGTLTLNDARNYPTLSLAPFPPGVGPDGFGANQQRNVQNFRFSNKTTIQTDVGQIDLNSWYIHNYLYHPIFVVIEQDQQSWGFSPRFTSHLEVAGHRNELIAGGRVWGGNGSDQWYSNYNGMIANPYGAFPPPAFSFPPFSFNGLAQFGVAASCFGFCGPFLDPGIDPRIRNNRQDAMNLQAYFEDRFYVAPQLAVMFGAKLFSDRRSYPILGGIPFEPLPGYDSKTYRGLNPKVGLLFEPTPDMQFFANMTGSRDVPDFIDLTQGNFPPPFQGVGSFHLGHHLLLLVLVRRTPQVQCESGDGHSRHDLQRQAHDPPGRRIWRERGSAARPHGSRRRRCPEAVADLELERLPFRQRSDLRQQPAPRHPPAHSAHHAGLQPSGRRLFRAGGRLGSARGLCRLCAYIAGARLCAARPASRHEAALWPVLLPRRAQSDRPALHQRRHDGGKRL